MKRHEGKNDEKRIEKTAKAYSCRGAFSSKRDIQQQSCTTDGRNRCRLTSLLSTMNHATAPTRGITVHVRPFGPCCRSDTNFIVKGQIPAGSRGNHFGLPDSSLESLVWSYGLQYLQCAYSTIAGKDLSCGGQQNGTHDTVIQSDTGHAVHKQRSIRKMWVQLRRHIHSCTGLNLNPFWILGPSLFLWISTYWEVAGSLSEDPCGAGASSLDVSTAREIKQLAQVGWWLFVGVMVKTGNGCTVT